jgi:uncharacterized C2H2 Zn-finger protein
MPTHHRVSSRRLGALPARYSFVLNSYNGERFTKCPSCDAPTRVRKLPLVVHIDHLNGPRLILLNKTCRLCQLCETLVVDRAELERVIVAVGTSDRGKVPVFVVLGTIDRRTAPQSGRRRAARGYSRTHGGLQTVSAGRCHTRAPGIVEPGRWLTDALAKETAAGI